MANVPRSGWPPLITSFSMSNHCSPAKIIAADIFLLTGVGCILRHAFATNQVVHYSVVNTRIGAVEEIFPRGSCVSQVYFIINVWFIAGESHIADYGGIGHRSQWSCSFIWEMFRDLCGSLACELSCQSCIVDYSDRRLAGPKMHTSCTLVQEPCNIYSWAVERKFSWWVRILLNNCHFG